MDSIISADDPSLTQAMDALAQMEAESSTTTGTTPTATDSATTPEPSATPAKNDSVQTPDTDKPGTPSATDPAKTASTEPAKPPSRFEKAVERQKNAWQQIETEKAEVRTIRKKLDDEKAAFAKERTTFESERQKASQPKYKPEDYESFAKQCEDKVKEHEGKGEFETATEFKLKAKQAREYAADLRANPPKPAPTSEEAETQFKEEQKKWYAKAITDFPDIGKAGSPEALKLKSLVESEPAIMSDPQYMYYAARLAVAESKSTVAARVPVLEKELGEARTKIKELEQKLTIPSDGSGPTNQGEVSFDKKPYAEQEAELERDAAAMGSNW